MTSCMPLMYYFSSSRDSFISSLLLNIEFTFSYENDTFLDSSLLLEIMGSYLEGVYTESYSEYIYLAVFSTLGLKSLAVSLYLLINFV